MSEARIVSGGKWQREHWRSLKTAYSNAPYWEDYSIFLQPTYEGKSPEHLVDFTLPLLKVCLEALHWTGELIIQESGEQMRQNDLATLAKPGKTKNSLPNGQYVSYPQMFGKEFEDITGRPSSVIKLGLRGEVKVLRE